MQVINCPLCGKIFKTESLDDVCDNCKEKYYEDFDKIRDYLYSNPNKNIVEVSIATGLSMENIKMFLKAGSLVSIEKKEDED